MSEIRNEISKLNIRGQLNLIFAMSKLLVSILEMAPDSKVACDTLNKTAEGVFEQAAILYRDIEEYTTDVSRSE